MTFNQNNPTTNIQDFANLITSGGAEIADLKNTIGQQIRVLNNRVNSHEAKLSEQDRINKSVDDRLRLITKEMELFKTNSATKATVRKKMWCV
eukprot:CAMPEP_0116919288 /NCGR_PEP_ID=MMETSP0467-20121206/20290_1 /TAXON_ID=283647 /ORGANISM="Mesodinium pulex, Strain SPMC105" /LENGTH=92 /DNA_ID=CAMNT_0004596825 /DNA_START=40 /DNA_END=318 /DNA_ORIENTATION=+